MDERRIKMMVYDMDQAWANWQLVDDSSLSGERFNRFIGKQYWRVIDDAANDNVSDQTRGRLNLLLGPHFRCVIKAYLAVQSEEVISE